MIPSRTVETRVLDHYPGMRRRLAESAEFAAWLQGLPSVDVDGETFYLRGGDLLRDTDQVMFEWARRHGVLTEEAIARAITGATEE